MNLQDLNQEQLKTDIPIFATGDTVRIHTRIQEGDKSRIQVFEGVVIKRTKSQSVTATFTVRRIASGIGVERTFLLHSTNVVKIELVRQGEVRRSRLFYLRNLKTKSINIKEKKRMLKTKTDKTKTITEETASAIT
jgi:large subunit ribosomal protein L19